MTSKYKIAKDNSVRPVSFHRKLHSALKHLRELRKKDLKYKSYAIYVYQHPYGWAFLED